MNRLEHLECLSMQFQLSHTHAYPGCHVRIAEEAIHGEELVEFTDGVTVSCTHRREGEAIVLTISPYRTARGTEIDEKAWRLQSEGATGDWKIAAKA